LKSKPNSNLESETKGGKRIKYSLMVSGNWNTLQRIEDEPSVLTPEEQQEMKKLTDEKVFDCKFTPKLVEIFSPLDFDVVNSEDYPWLYSIQYWMHPGSQTFFLCPKGVWNARNPPNTQNQDLSNLRKKYSSNILKFGTIQKLTSFVSFLESKLELKPSHLINPLTPSCVSIE